MITTTFVAPEIECQGCATSIKKSVGALPGVASVTVAVDAKRVEITHDDTVSVAVLRETMQKTGFTAEQP